MFGVLDKYSDTEAIDIVYYLIKMLTKATNGTEIEDVPIDLSDEHLAVAEGIFDELVKKLPGEQEAQWEARLEGSIKLLYKYIEDRTVSGDPEDVERGKKLLDNFKLTDM